ncbi:hypothetical protein N9L68_01220 [bacterium]|nr:hypothetical protein [bacterium]
MIRDPGPPGLAHEQPFNPHATFQHLLFPRALGTGDRGGYPTSNNYSHVRSRAEAMATTGAQAPSPASCSLSHASGQGLEEEMKEAAPTTPRGRAAQISERSIDSPPCFGQITTVAEKRADY